MQDPVLTCPQRSGKEGTTSRTFGVLSRNIWFLCTLLDYSLEQSLRSCRVERRPPFDVSIGCSHIVSTFQLQRALSSYGPAPSAAVVRWMSRYKCDVCVRMEATEGPRGEVPSRSFSLSTDVAPATLATAGRLHTSFRLCSNYHHARGSCRQWSDLSAFSHTIN